MLNLTDENFEREILASGKPVLVDFWAEWCGPCRVLAPILEKISADFAEKIVVAKVNVDEAPLSSQKYNIAQIPTVILFKEGKSVGGFIGVKTEESIKQWLDENI